MANMHQIAFIEFLPLALAGILRIRMCLGLLYFSAIFAKPNSCCDFLFTFLDDKTLSDRVHS